MFWVKLSSISLVLFFLLSFNSYACDDKPCERAYLAETQQYIANHYRRAQAYKAERHAYSMNRERRAYALYRHIHLILFGRV